VAGPAVEVDTGVLLGPLGVVVGDARIACLLGPEARLLDPVRALRRHLASAETFPHALERFGFFKIFEGVVVSGEEKMKKPSAEFYKIIIDRYHLDPSTTIFIDDSLRNVKGAESVGITGIHFHNPSQLKEALQRMCIEIF
jgi:phosphoglycolate phosphatase-like HAD superfamily hydrolase